MLALVVAAQSQKWRDLLPVRLREWPGILAGIVHGDLLYQRYTGQVLVPTPAFDALLYAMLSIRALPPATRRAWGAFFEQYVFGEAAATLEHIAPERRGILGKLSAEQRAEFRPWSASAVEPTSELDSMEKQERDQSLPPRTIISPMS